MLLSDRPFVVVVVVYFEVPGNSRLGVFLTIVVVVVVVLLVFVRIWQLDQ